MTAALVVLYAVGTLAALGFLAVYRPREWRRVEALNAAGWILVVPVVFARALILIGLHGGVRPSDGLADAVVSIGSLVIVDALVVLRTVSFWRYRRRRV